MDESGRSDDADGGGAGRQAAMLREADHRVKNDLQLIASVIQLQSRRTEDPAARLALRAALRRVSAIAAVHRHVSRDEGRETLDLTQMVRLLASDLAGGAGREGLTLRMDLDAIVVDAPHGGALALIASELVANALHHAFPGARSGTVEVGLRRTAEGFVLTVADDGVGGPDDLRQGFGLGMAHMLCRQLGATSRVVATQPGLRVTVTVPMIQKAA